MGQKKASLLVRCPHEVSSFQRLKCMQEWYWGWEKVSSYTTLLPRNRLKESTRDVEREVP